MADKQSKLDEIFNNAQTDVEGALWDVESVKAEIKALNKELINEAYQKSENMGEFLFNLYEAVERL